MLLPVARQRHDERSCLAERGSEAAPRSGALVFGGHGLGRAGTRFIDTNMRRTRLSRPSSARWLTTFTSGSRER